MAYNTTRPYLQGKADGTLEETSSRIYGGWGVRMENNNGIAVLDFDGDGDNDVYFPSGHSHGHIP